MNNKAHFKCISENQQYKRKYFDVTITEYDKGLGQKEYKAEIYCVEKFEDVIGFEEMKKQLKTIFPDFREDRITHLEFDNCTSLIYVGELPFSEFNNLRVFKANGMGNVFDDPFYLSALSSPVLEKAEVKSQIFKKNANEVHLNIRSKSLKEIICDGYPVPVKYLNSERTVWRTVRGITLLGECGIPLTDQNAIIAADYAEREDVGLRTASEFGNYDELGLKTLLDFKNGTDPWDTHNLDEDGGSRFALKSAFCARFNDRYPKKLRPFIAVVRDGDYTAEEVVEKFNFKQFSQADIPFYTRLVMMMALDKNEYRESVKNGNADLIAKLCISVHARSRHPMEEKLDPDAEKRFTDAARFLIKHPKINSEFALELTKAVHDVRTLHITPEMSTEAVKSAVLTASGAEEMSKIEDEYSGFDFKKAVFDLRFSDVESGNLHAGIMKPGDTRMAILGQATNCCQHLGSTGETAMMYGLVYEHAGFWIIEDKNTHKIFAQAEIWEKNPDTLVFDNIEFADDRDVSQFSELIGLWAKNSPYKNIYMGTGYNHMAEEMGEKMTVVSGCMPPMNEAVKSIIKKSIYSDANIKQAVIKKDDVVDPFFSKNHDGRLLVKGSEEPRKPASVAELQERYPNCVSLKYFDELAEMIRSGTFDLPAEKNYLIEKHNELLKETPKAEIVLKALELYERDTNIEYRYKVRIQSFCVTCRDLMTNQLLKNMPFDEFKENTRELVLLQYNKTQRSHSRDVIPVKVIEAIDDTLEQYRNDFAKLKESTPVELLKESLNSHPDCRKGCRSGNAEMVPVNTVISVDSINFFAGADSPCRYYVKNAMYQVSKDYFDNNGYRDFVLKNWDTLSVNPDGYEPRIIPESLEVVKNAYNVDAELKDLGLAHVACYLDAVSKSLGDEVPQALVPDPKKATAFMRKYRSISEPPVETIMERTLNDYFHDMRTNSCPNIPFEIYVEKKGEEPPSIGEPVTVHCSVITRSGGELEHSFGYTFGTDPERIKEEIVSWADDIIPNRIIDEASVKYPESTENQRQEYAQSIVNARKELLKVFDGDGHIREQLKMRLQEEKASVYEPVKISQEQADSSDKEISGMEDITFEELDEGLQNLLEASGYNDLCLVGDCLRIPGETEETSQYIPVKGITEEEFIKILSEGDTEFHDPCVREFADQIIGIKNFLMENEEQYL